MIKEAIHMLVNNINLSESEMAECMQEIMEGKATDAQIGAFLSALRMKGETVEEITGAARIMREKAPPSGRLKAFSIPAGQAAICLIPLIFLPRLLLWLQGQGSGCEARKPLCLEPVGKR